MEEERERDPERLSLYSARLCTRYLTCVLTWTLLVTVMGKAHHLHFAWRKLELGHTAEEPRFGPGTAEAEACALNHRFPATWETLGLKR